VGGAVPVKAYNAASPFYGAAPAQTTTYSGGTTTNLVPDIFDCALGGRPYMLDESQPFYRQHRRQLEPLIRTQADTSNEPGEQSMDPNGLWRRSVEDWRLGFGQRYVDRNASQRSNYWYSKGVNTLTDAWEMHLLPDTLKTASSANTNLEVLWADAYVYFVDGELLWYAPISTIHPGAAVAWTAVGGLPTARITSACTDGYTVYLAMGAEGLWTVGPGGSPVAQLVTDPLNSDAVVGYGNGRLMVGNGGSLYNIVSTTAAALPTALMVAGNPNAVWNCFTGGNNWLYCGMNVGGVGYIYGVQTSADGTTLDPPVVQAQLANGEKVYSLYGYEGYLIVGTGYGVRACQQGANGLTLGTLVPVGTWVGMPTALPNEPPYGTPVQCLFAWRDDVWFGWSNYDSGSTGLGKLSLENWVVAGLLPAAASDLMATAQGAVTGVTIVNGVILFAVAGQGLFLQHSNLVPSGMVQSGYILFDLTDPKVPALLDVQASADLEHGSYVASISVDSGPFGIVGYALPNSLITNTFTLNLGSGSRFELLLTLQADTANPAAGPTLSRWTLRVYPAPLRPRTWQLPLILSSHVEDVTGQSWEFDPEEEIKALEEMANLGLPVLYQEGSEAYTVFVTDVSFISRTRSQTSERTYATYFEGLALINIQSIPVPDT
jgi:hypothetical protein